jgi:hypothetical protein
MDLATLLLVNVGKKSAAWLLKYFMGDEWEAAATIASGVTDSMLTKAGDAIQQDRTRKHFESLGSRIAQNLLAAFETEEMHRTKIGGVPHIEQQKVVEQIGLTLCGNVDPKFLLRGNLDEEKLKPAFRKARPLPDGVLKEIDTRFYDRVLDQVIVSLVAAADGLPGFQQKSFGEVLDRLDSQHADTLKKLQEMQEWQEQRWEQAERVDPANAEYEVTYREHIARTLNYLELFGADLPVEARRHSLSVAYVSLNLRQEGKDGKESRTMAVDSVLDELSPKAGRLLIRGDAGSGKSTLSRWAARKAARGLDPVTLYEMAESAYQVARSMRHGAMYGAIGSYVGDAETAIGEKRTEVLKEMRLNTWLSKVPFLIRLRDCPGGELPAPDDFPRLVAKLAGNPPAGWVQAVLKAGRGLVLLDGVDEVAKFDRDKLFAEIKGLCDTFKKCYFLVSTRPEAVPEGWLKRLKFREASISPMSATGRNEFIDSWHLAVKIELKRLEQPTDALESEAEELKNKFENNPTMARLATNPLMAAMICALHRRSSQHLPPTEVELVERLCFMLLDQRDRESGLREDVNVEAFRKLPYKDKRMIVQDIAYHMLVERCESSLDRVTAKELVAKRLKSRQHNPDDAEDVLRAIIERSGMLREKTPQALENGDTVPAKVEFLHNTFKEYLAGMQLGNAGAVGLLAEHWDHADWVPAILFAVTVERPKLTDEVIEKILPPGSLSRTDKLLRRTRKRANLIEKDVETRKRILLTLRCRAVGADVDPELQSRLQHLEEMLFPPRTMTEAEALAEAGDALLPFLDRLAFAPGRNVNQTAACIRALRQSQLKPAQSLLDGFLKDERHAVIEELAQAVNPLTIQSVQQMVQSEFGFYDFEQQRSLRKQITDVSPLVQLASLQTLDLTGTQVSDVSPLAQLISLRTLNLLGTSVSDLNPIAQHTSLQTLILAGTEVSDVSPLAQLTSLQTLNLNRTQVSNLSPLAQLTSLQCLSLNLTQVSDVSPLIQLTSLQTLYLSRTQVSDKAVEVFHLTRAKAGLPKVEVLTGTDI